MARAEWTYELSRGGGGDLVWLEEYLVYDCDGAPAGKVVAVLEHEGRRWLAIERSHVPDVHDRRAIPLETIAELDHENLGVHLSIGREALDAALELPPENAAEAGAEARRVVEPPASERPQPLVAAVPGRADRLSVAVAPFLAVCAALSLLAVLALYGAHRSTVRLAFLAIPAAFLVASALVGSRAWARPWRRDSPR